MSHIIIKDTELAQLLDKNEIYEHVYIEVISNELTHILTITYATVQPYTYLINDNIPKDIIDKIKTLLTLGMDKDIAFDCVKPYVI